MAITGKDIMDLRERTGVGINDCKKALTEADGNIDKAVEILREKGMAQAAKKAGRIASQGIVDSYIHLGGKIGVIVEVNCETDFVAMGDKFKALVHDIALHIAASRPEFVSADEVPAERIENEKKIYREQLANEGKPAAVIEKILEGKISKFYEDIVLLNQKFVKDPSKTMEQLVAEATGSIGEKISIRRFVRYEMGEGLAKREDNFAEEINAMAAKVK